MRRLLLLLILLAILPLQFAWAAATAYCQHESGEATKHFGHHEHQHRADTATKDTKVPLSAVADNDCGTCHLSAAQPIPSAIGSLPAPGADPPRFVYRARCASFIPIGPERPDRSAPAPAVRFGGAVGIGASISA